MIDSGGPGSNMFRNTVLHWTIVVEVVQVLQQISCHREHTAFGAEASEHAPNVVRDCHMSVKAWLNQVRE